MYDVFFAKLRARDDLTDREEEALRGVFSQVRTFERGSCVIRSGEEVHNSLLLIDGFACRSKMMRDGNRQILELNLPGDFVDLHGFLLQKLDHNLETVTECTLAYAPHTALREVTAEHPHLTRLLWLNTVVDAAIHRESVLSLARRPAIGRIAHLFVELHIRMQLVGRADATGFDLPLTQPELGEICGLTSVHVNRTLKSLREQGLAAFRKGRVDLLDIERLRKISEFDPTYLSLFKRPR